MESPTEPRLVADTERVNVYIPADLVKKLRDLAARNRRSLSGEAAVAIEEHLQGAGE